MTARAEAGRTGGQILELGCGTGHKLIPLASDGYSCVGLDLSSDMLAEARRKADRSGVVVEWLQGDMTAFDLGPRVTCAQELPLLISLGGLRLVERFGDWSGAPFSGEAALQLCVCESA